MKSKSKLFVGVPLSLFASKAREIFLSAIPNFSHFVVTLRIRYGAREITYGAGKFRCGAKEI